MPGEFITKRPHKKSRAGCTTCKTKKVKCDEAQPKCTFCQKRDLKCVYPSPSSKSSPSPVQESQALVSRTRSSSPDLTIVDFSAEDFWDFVNAPVPSIATSAGGLSPNDMKLMHHWSTLTWQKVAIGEVANNMLQITVPQLAFENEWLMNALLGLASLHKQYLLPDGAESRKQTDIYRAKALSGFRKALPNISPYTKDYEAALVMSILLVVLCSRDYIVEDGDMIIIQWLILYRGLSAVINLTTFPDITKMAVGPIFRRELTPLKLTPAIPTLLIDMVRDISPTDPDFLYLEDYCKVLDSIGVLYAGLQQDGLSPEFYIRVVTWPSFGTQNFCTCAVERRPRALVILSYYLLFVKLVQGLWWVEDFSNREITTISKFLGPQWQPFIEVPLQALKLDDRSEIAKIMLGQQ